MLTANFPAKREARRQRALVRLKTISHNGLSEERKASLEQELAALNVAPYGNPRGNRTKKDRTARAKIKS